MSGKAGSIGSILTGVVLVIAGALTAGVSTPLIFAGAGLILSGSVGLAFSPKGLTPDNYRAQELQIANSGEGFPVPVVFGEGKIVPNFMNWRADSFRAVDIVQTSGGGKGGAGVGGSQVTGHDYFLTFEVGLCMGPIDEIGQIISVPGDVPVRGKAYSTQNGITAAQAGITVTASANTFLASQVGATFIWADGSTDTITAYLSKTQVRVSVSRTKTSQSFQIYSTPEQIIFSDTFTPSFATGIFTMTLRPTSLGLDLIIGAITYRVMTYGFSPPLNDLAYQVSSGANINDALTNLKNCINGGTGAGTTYSNKSKPHPLVTATNTSTTLTITSREPGVSGNTIETSFVTGGPFVYGTWANTHLTGGTAEDFREVNVSGINEGGLIRIYRGNRYQVRATASDPYSDTGMNYRNICWALFMDFWINRNQAVPKTYQFIIRRFPKCIRDDGSTASGIETRASYNSFHAAYNMANPAAAIYELMTNRLWGRGISSDEIDEPSFEVASLYFRQKNLGCSFVLDSPDKLVTILDSLRMQFRTQLTWDNGKWKLRCLLDPAQTAETILTLTDSEVNGLEVNRPMWPGTANELRVEFNSKDKLYKPDSVHVADLGNMAITGRSNPLNITLRAMTEWNIVLRQAHRILREISYPAMRATFKMNRFRSQLAVGDTFRLIWKEWGADTVTAYFRVIKLQPQGKSDDIKVTASEDPFLSPVSGSETTISLPTSQAWEKINPIDYRELSLFSFPDSSNGAILPIAAFEMPAMMTGGLVHKMMVLGEKPSPGTLGAQLVAAREGTSNYGVISGTPSFAVAGELLTPVTHSRQTDRTESFLQFSLFKTADAYIVLGANQVSSDSDSLETLANGGRDYFFIGDEIIQVGVIEQLDANQFRARNVIRGCFGSRIHPHPVGSPIFYMPVLAGEYATGQVILNNIVKFRAYPITTAGVNQIGGDFYTEHADSEQTQFYLGLGVRPLTPEPISIVKVGSGPSAKFTIVIRPRFVNHGAGVGPLIGDYDPDTDTVSGAIKTLNASLGSMSYVARYLLNNGTKTGDFVVRPQDTTVTPEALDSQSAGLVTMINFPAVIGTPEVTGIEIRSVLNNYQSAAPARFAATL